MSFCDRIKDAIARSHVAVEATPIAQAIVNGDVTRANYTLLLTQLVGVHADFERRASLLRNYFDDGTVAAVFRTAAIRSDLTILAEPQPLPACSPGDDLGDKLDSWTQSSPWMVLGTAYILEGSRMGSMFLVRALAKAFAVPMEPGHGLDYHLAGLATRRQDWTRFRGHLDSLPLTESQRNDVLFAAIETMKSLHNIYEAIPTGQLVTV